MKNNNKNIILTIVIPVYNGSVFLDNSMHSIINSISIEEDILEVIEILIINDGSKDDSLKKAQKWEKEWNKKVRPDFIKIIDKENGQYGSVINKGIELANGKYIKVLDVDDVFISKNFVDVIKIISGLKTSIDIILTDFIFDKVINNKQILYNWSKYFEPYKILNTSNLKYPKLIITMHSIIYRTNFLKSIKYKQLEGVYYSDSQYSLIPFVQAKRLYYINMPIYRYFIGRNDQSINIKSMIKNRLDQREVMFKIIEELNDIIINSKQQKLYAWYIAKNMIEWQSMIISNDKTLNNREKIIYNDLINILKICKDENNIEGYKLLKKGILSKIIRTTKGKGVVKIILFGQKLYSKFKLNIMADWD